MTGAPSLKPRLALAGRGVPHGLSVAVLQTAFLAATFVLVLPHVLKGQEQFSGSAREVVAALAVGVADAALVVLFATLWLGRLRLRDLGWTGKPTGRSVLLAGLGLLLSLSTSLAMARIAFKVPVTDALASLSSYTAAQRLLFLIVGLQAAFVEETIFRGRLHLALRSSLGRTGAILVGAAVFALYHLNVAPAPLASKFISGVIFACLREWDGALWAPAGAHLLIWAVVGAF